MKKLLIPFLFLFGVAVFIACQKENSSNGASVDAAKSSGIKKGEPVTFTVDNVSGQAAKWAITPSTNVQLTENGNKATISFGNAGAYSVTATMGNTLARILVTVSDSSYTDTTRTDSSGTGGGIRDSLFSLTGDQIHITPSAVDSFSISGLFLSATTEHTYPCFNHTLERVLTDSGNIYTLHFTDVRVAGTCVTGGQSPATSGDLIHPASAGTHIFRVILNGVTYSGSFVKTGNHYVFTWPYTSGVTISPLSIN